MLVLLLNLLLEVIVLWYHYCIF